MSSSQSLGFPHLVKRVQSIVQKFTACSGGNGATRRKPEELPTPSFDWGSARFTTTEISDQLSQVFKLIDVNGDGKISPLELGEVLVCLGHEKSTATKEAEGMVKMVDCNGDGFIDLEEFMEVVGEKSKDGSDSGEELMEAFLIFDSDKNGFISAQELQRVLISLGHHKCSLEECLHMIRGVDKDGNDLVDFEEFRLMMAKCAG